MSSKLEHVIISCSEEDGGMTTPLCRPPFINVPNILMMVGRCIVFLPKKSLLKEKKVYFTDAAMYEEKRPSVKKHVVETNTAESSRTISQQQKEKPVVRFADKPEPFKVKVKPDREKSKPLVILTKSSKSINTASPVGRLYQGNRWSDLSWAPTANGQTPQDCSGIGYR